jgi:DHA2 family methylenomycin A resistance protein-like MFS transporter
MPTTSNLVTAQQPSLTVLMASSFAFIIVQLDVTIVNVALPRMGLELGAQISTLRWVIDAYTLGFASFLLSAGVMGDKFGSKRVFLSGFVLFTLASAACALAPSAMALDLARAMQGVGAALLVPSSLAILNSTYADDKTMLAKAIGWWTAAGGVSIAAGPVIGGMLLSIAGWRSIFWVNVPICVIGFALTYYAVPRSVSKEQSRHFDLPGQLLSVLALIGFIGAVIEVHALGVSSLVVQGGFVLAFIAGGGFLVVERRASAPMLPLTLFHSMRFSGAVLFGVLANFSYYGVIFVLSFYLQKGRGYTVIETGLTFLPLTGTAFFSNIAVGRLSARIGLRALMVGGGLIGCSGYALLGIFGISDHATFFDMLPGLALVPIGMGFAVPAMTTSILSSVEKHQAGTASAVLNTARQVGGATGVAFLGAIVASGPAAAVICGVRSTMMISAALLLAAVAIAFWSKAGGTQPRIGYVVARDGARRDGHASG